MMDFTSLIEKTKLLPVSAASRMELAAEDKELLGRHFDSSQLLAIAENFMGSYTHFLFMAILGKKKGALESAPPTPTERLTDETGPQELPEARITLGAVSS
jgi:hypothetical protein